MAERSIHLNHLEDQVQMIHDDLKNLLNHVPRTGVDLILCNPPYFKVSETSKKMSLNIIFLLDTKLQQTLKKFVTSQDML